MTRTRLAAVLCGAIAIGTGAGVAHAFTISGAKWSVLPVQVYLNPANRDVSALSAETAIVGALKTWSSASLFRYTYAGRVSDTATGYNGRSVILFRNSKNGSAVATTYTWAVGGVKVEFDMVLWDAAYRFSTGTTGCSYGAYIEDIATHELGHALGLGHSSVSSATMYPTYKSCTQWMRSLASDDINGLRARYP